MRTVGLLLAVMLLTATAASAQNAAPAPPPPPGEKAFFFTSIGPDENMLYLEHMDMQPVKGAPYTATASTESTQVLADGNRIVHNQSGLVARDSEGRTRREEQMMAMGPLAVKSGKHVMIHDPVSKTMTMLDLDEKTAHVMNHNGPNTMKVMPLHDKTAHAGGDPHVMMQRSEEEGSVQHESLGTQTIEGVSAEGTRVTRTIAAGAIGNDKPIVVTIERWTSPDLHTLVLMKRSDPRFGETTFKLTNIKTGEPDASLFQVPAGFKTEQGPMRMPMHVPPPPAQ